MAAAGIKLLAGLGNPGQEYEGTRHNAGAMCVAAFCRQEGVSLQADARGPGLSGRLQGDGLDCRILIPDAFVNCSGGPVQAVASYYKIRPEEILIAHDELDFPPGAARFKEGGGHGGHNGLRDVSRAIGGAYSRLRLGIGHPGRPERVSGYVLARAPAAEGELIEAAMAAALAALPLYLRGERAAATRQLHSAG